MRLHVPSKAATASSAASRAARGYTLIELLVTVAVVAIIAAMAIPSFASLIDRERVGAASDGLVRAAQLAKAHAIQTGKRTTLIINGSALSNCSSQDVAWAIKNEDAGVSDQAVLCLSKTDFLKRFSGATLSPTTTQTITYTPLGIANNDSKLTYTTSSSDRSKSITIYPGGAIVSNQCTRADGVTTLGTDC